MARLSSIQTGCRAVGLGALLLIAVVALRPAPVAAGCGCDHPAPSMTALMPPFGAPGTEVKIFAVDGAFIPGETYEVDFRSGEKVDVVAVEAEFILATVPAGAVPGAAAVDVQGLDFMHTYTEAEFTVLGQSAKMPAHGGIFVGRRIKVAVTADGTLLLPVDVSEVLEPTQFAFAFRRLPLQFEAEDVVIYNRDGVDLTLFTLGVEDGTERQWGSYYGWNVSDDTGLRGDVFESKVRRSIHRSFHSDVFTYWRHEFYTYADAHAPGGSHEVDESGYHPDWTLHVDHDHLVIAIKGVKLNRWDPDDLSKARELRQGRKRVNLVAVAVQSDTPIEPDQIAVQAAAAQLDEHDLFQPLEMTD
jgi:hypothetical protein